jgi:hypothetical protein
MRLAVTASRSWRRRAVAASAICLLCGCDAASSSASIPGVVVSSAAGGSSRPTGTPKVSDATQAARTFLADLRAKDCASAYALVADPLRGSTGSPAGLCAAQQVNGAYSVGDATALTPTSAFVTVTLGSGGQQGLDTITLLYNSSQWYVSEIVANGTATPTGGGLNGSGIEATIAQQYEGQNSGVTATVTCPGSGGPYTPGQQFQCTFSDTSGRSGTLTVTIGSSPGAFTWTIP